jgi:DNA-binding transcriptional LysR family regulator
VAGWAAYCSEDYAARNGLPQAAEQIEGHALITMDTPHADWLLFAAPAATATCRSNSIPNLCAMVKAGMGIGGLPCIVGEVEPELRRCFMVPDLCPPVWLVYHERLRGETHVRAFLDFLTSHVLAKKALLAGLTS